MGSEDLFHQRRKGSSRSLARKKAKRDVYDRVLIVCEGEKTEPNYLRELIEHLRLNSANVEVDGSSGSSPVSVWDYAKKYNLDETKKGDAYDRVYCVIDRDSHTTYNATVEAIRLASPKNTYYAITSVPCFEYWVLLHYNYTTRAYGRAGSNSPCDNVINDLENYMPGYTKGDKGVFAAIMGQTDFAIVNARRALTQAQQTGTDNPTTLIYELVEYLRNLK